MQAISRLKAKKNIRSLPVQVSVAFHSKYLTKMKQEFKDHLLKLKIKPPKMRVIRNLDLKVYQTPEEIIEGLVEQIDNPVLFQPTIEKCFNEGLYTFHDVNFVNVYY